MAFRYFITARMACLKFLLRLDFFLLSFKYTIVDHHVADGVFSWKKIFSLQWVSNICEMKSLNMSIFLLLIVTTFYLYVFVLCFPRLSVSLSPSD